MTDSEGTSNNDVRNDVPCSARDANANADKPPEKDVGSYTEEPTKAEAAKREEVEKPAVPEPPTEEPPKDYGWPLRYEGDDDWFVAADDLPGK